ncbi:sensor histidine kinase [Cellvibrio sp. pealriver]|uniref:sensor histidine kinase n=1 Tax=Cellvibrio sp. pealriver TaxID=1622269 RepID=UPI0018CD1373|nr:histidine kinase [Cellvibrio sp. pealriver]
MNIGAGFIIVLLFTLAVLLFRYWYNTKQWYLLSSGKHLAVCFGAALIISAVLTALWFALLVSLFLDSLMNPELLQERGLTEARVVAHFFINNTVVNMALLCGWMFIYTTMKSGQRADRHEIENLHLQNTLKEAQLTSLTNQLNPHFLFNALNNIRFMIHENPDHADHMVTTLADLLRYSLVTNQCEKVSIEQELAMVNHQLAICALQMEHRLDARIDVPAALLKCSIPPMVLQMLVENALKHGIDHLDDVSTLHIQGIQKNNEIRFTISNPVPEQAPPVPGTGTGHKNIKKRLAILYGDKAGLQVESRVGLFSVTLHFPMEYHYESASH